MKLPLEYSSPQSLISNWFNHQTNSNRKSTASPFRIQWMLWSIMWHWSRADLFDFLPSIRLSGCRVLESRISIRKKAGLIIRPKKNAPIFLGRCIFTTPRRYEPARCNKIHPWSRRKRCSVWELGSMFNVGYLYDTAWMKWSPFMEF